MRAYGTGGILANPPTAAAQGYILVGGGTLDQYLTYDKGIFGGWVQLLYGLQVGRGSQRLRLGLDVGWQKLFSDRFDLHDADGSLIIQDYQENTENTLRVLAVAEHVITPRPFSFFVQAGVGTNFVSLTYMHTFIGKYTTDYGSDAGSENSFGIEAAAVVNILTFGKVSIPVLVRVDYLAQYG